MIATQDAGGGVQLSELPGDLISAPEAARWLKVSLSGLHLMRRRADDPVPAYRIGHCYFFSRREVLGWIARRSQGAFTACA